MRRGFTLIELLVVIAIIAILAAILFPVFARAREKARQASCTSNVKQITLGLLMYAQDYDERFGLSGGWNGTALWAAQWPIAIQPYIKNWQLLECPSNPYRSGPWVYWGQTHQLRENYAALPGLEFQSLARVTEPASKILVIDSNHQAVPDWNRAQYACICPSGTTCADGLNNRKPSNCPHNEGVNVGFVDGHAKWGRHTGSSTPPQGWLP